MAAATINVPHASIVQAITKTMIYRTCPECNGKLTMVFANSSGKRAPNEFYCKKCRQYATTFKTSYRLQLTVVNTIDNSVENLIAFDEAVMPLMGCPASEFDEVRVHITLLLC
jgi:RecJ-like exonuclease